MALGRPRCHFHDKDQNQDRYWNLIRVSNHQAAYRSSIYLLILLMRPQHPLSYWSLKWKYNRIELAECASRFAAPPLRSGHFTSIPATHLFIRTTTTRPTGVRPAGRHRDRSSHTRYKTLTLKKIRCEYTTLSELNDRASNLGPFFRGVRRLGGIR